MRIGFVGPARGNVTRFRELCELLLFDLAVDRVVYLGADDTLDRAVKGWAAQLGAPADDVSFLTEVALLAPDARVIGPRGFLTPGGVASLGGAHVAVVEGLPAGLRMALHDARGRLTQELVLSPGRASKMEVRST